MSAVDDPRAADNRRYDWSRTPHSDRAEYDAIVEMVPRGARVVDLGCGNGSLLARLRDEKGCDGLGVDAAESGVLAARAKGLRALHAEIDRPLESLRDGEFDYAVCNVTLQMVLYPEVLMAEMGRLAPHQVVSFPNFAYAPNRLDLLLRGRMPRPMLFGYSWFSTGHIHQLSVADFLDFCDTRGFEVLRLDPVEARRPGLPGRLARAAPNLFSAVCVALCRRREA